MTSPQGYARLMITRETCQQRMWSWMRRRRIPWTVAHLAESTKTSMRLARRYVERLAAHDYLKQRGEQGGDTGRFAARAWVLAHNSGPVAPMLTGGSDGDGLRERNSDMSGAELRRIRERLGLGRAAFANDVLGVRDYRTASRYESLDIVPAVIAERTKKWR